MEVLLAIAAAFVSGGALVRLIEVFANRSKSVEDLSASERLNLREDIKYLRSELDKLRGRIESLENDLSEQRRRVARWQRAYWQLKTRADRIVDHLVIVPQLLHLNPELSRMIDVYKEHEGEDEELT